MTKLTMLEKLQQLKEVVEGLSPEEARDLYEKAFKLQQEQEEYDRDSFYEKYEK